MYKWWWWCIKKDLQKEKEFWKLRYAEVVAIKVIELQKTELVGITVILELLRKIFTGKGIDNHFLKYFLLIADMWKSNHYIFISKERLVLAKTTIRKLINPKRRVQLGFKLATLPASMILLLKDRLESETEIWQVARLEPISVSNGQPSDTFPTLLG